MEINRVVLLEMIMPALGFVTDSVEVFFVEAPPNESSVINKNTFFLIRVLKFFPIIIIIYFKTP